jgi:hypothetical protein
MNQHWHWQTWEDHAYLTCDLLSPWQHGFFTQDFYPRLPEELTSIWRSQSPKGLALTLKGTASHKDSLRISPSGASVEVIQSPIKNNQAIILWLRY